MFELLFWVFATLLLVMVVVRISKRNTEYLVALYAAMVVIANVLASKVTVFLFWEVDAGTIVYASMFLITDILSEFYGKKIAKKAVWAGFFASVVYVFSVWVAMGLEPSANWPFQQSFIDVFGNSWRIVLGSMIAYLISQHHDIWAYHFWKKLTRGKYLWLRNNLSTIVSQLIDSVVFVSIAFYGIFPVGEMIIGLWLFKVLIAVIDTPFMYLAKWVHK